MITDVNLSDKSKTYGLYGRKFSSRKNFKINSPQEDKFYRTDETVKTEIDAGEKDDAYWAEHRHEKLSEQELKIDEMVDSLNNNPYFKRLKSLTYLATQGYYVINKIEIGNAFGLFSTNPIEKFRVSLGLRTSNNFSKRTMLGVVVGYGFGDEKFKFQGMIRQHLSKRKRTMLDLYFKNDFGPDWASSWVINCRKHIWNNLEN